MASVTFIYVGDARRAPVTIPLHRYCSVEERAAAKGINIKQAIKNQKRRLRYQSQIVRSFPTGYTSAADYISKFCQLNHLKEC